jgi:hypothetical protein
MSSSSNQQNPSGSSGQSLSEKYKKWDQIAKEVDEDPECNTQDELNGFFQVNTIVFENN